MKTLWSRIQSDPVFMRRVNGWLTIAWVGMIPVSILTGWVNLVAYIAALSLWTLVSGHWSAWQAARVEVAQQQTFEEMSLNPIEDRVVEAIVHETTIERDDTRTTQFAPAKGTSLEIADSRYNLRRDREALPVHRPTPHLQGRAACAAMPDRAWLGRRSLVRARCEPRLARCQSRDVAARRLHDRGAHERSRFWLDSFRSADERFR